MSDSERQMTQDSETPEPSSEGGSGPARRRWPRWLGMVVLGLVILGSGIVIGSVGTLVVVKRGIADAVQHPERIPERTVDRMARRYDLTDEQRAKVEAILTTRLQRMAQIRRRIRPHVDAQLDSLREDVAEVLSEKQAAQWREDFKRLRRVVQVPMYAPQAPESEAGGESVAE